MLVACSAAIAGAMLGVLLAVTVPVVATELPATTGPQAPVPSGDSGPPTDRPDPPEGAGSLTPERTEALLVEGLAPSLAAETTEDELDALLARVAVDEYALEIEALWGELVVNGWSLSGSPRVLDVDPITGDTADGRAEVIACIDSSDVVLRDSEGAPIGAQDDEQAVSRHRLVLALGDDGQWRIARHDFPEDARC